ncbi:MAG TPA: tRNA uridine-5-carboxymethylaminomethyl(34) synthesis GTPase MnmE [Gammaproteobacteria bacterium]|nr:tRNA uridine-5-carboxymethylaminomethyl(34) synthesis GTPase MnmE [Gammaproteobacteria bacterium]
MNRKTGGSAETIVAAATAPGHGAIGIIRFSGPQAAAIGRKITGIDLLPRHAHYARFRDAAGDVIDEGLALHFPAPHSYTGEDMLELQTHGNPVILGRIATAAVCLGARPARPGEFTERAFLNGRLDLTQAEAVADLIGSQSAAGVRSALASLQGEFSAHVRSLSERLRRQRVEMEAMLDFSEDDVNPGTWTGQREATRNLVHGMDEILANCRRGVLFTEGLKVAILGRPNAGKSSLFNRLLSESRAIVNETPGTTRDILRAEMQIGGVPMTLVDTAGLRGPAQGVDAIEQEGMRRAREALAWADHVLLVIPWGESLNEEDQEVLVHRPAGAQVTFVRSKIDRVEVAAAECDAEQGREVWLSAVTGAGMDLLERRLLPVQEQNSGTYTARRRHVIGLETARAHVSEAERLLAENAPTELAAEQLRLAGRQLDQITGEYTTEELLGDIFRRFCVGK